MAHHLAPSLTSGSNLAPATTGQNFYVTTYTLPETLSTSMTISLAALPPGARVSQMDLTLDNANIIDTQTVSSVQSVQLWAGLVGQTSGGTGKVVTYITSAQAGNQINTWTPNEVALGYRLTASSQVVYVLSNGAVGSGTLSTIFTLAISYDTQQDGD